MSGNPKELQDLLVTHLTVILPSLFKLQFELYSLLRYIAVIDQLFNHK